MFCLYILYSNKEKQLYVGQTSNLEERLREHLSGKNFSTKSKLPLSLIHTEFYKTRSEAMKREKFLKSLYGSKFKSEILKKFLTDGSSKS
ncbi:MAG: excinuclease ABC subunit C [Candidatus Nealsonbacteria bacterium CG23_combo_of_CG06-09_8_20_14_all_38_19]|uniref:Excinuclease ABC subunit C n=2 Tax=Candidatus Nealsoniibacteriota TaxID=1817911 RepID=A0A2G9YX85_9BACT|nr:MAG: excinuclease ABC subunit C [Candidatus Nealsonbacteria bacterium CG23_combo_of_CG06-09_8_20_14_all_38_19]